MRPKVVLGILIAAACILLVPFVAMQFTDHVSWGPVDFVVAGGLLVGTGLLFELAASRMRKPASRSPSASRSRERLPSSGSTSPSASSGTRAIPPT
jgi:hypothetical protein